ncbi:unnamed protein product, partial [Prorocentrum cordatum]
LGAVSGARQAVSSEGGMRGREDAGEGGPAAGATAALEGRQVTPRRAPRRSARRRRAPAPRRGRSAGTPAPGSPGAPARTSPVDLRQHRPQHPEVPGGTEAAPHRAVHPAGARAALQPQGGLPGRLGASRRGRRLVPEVLVAGAELFVELGGRNLQLRGLRRPGRQGAAAGAHGAAARRQRAAQSSAPPGSSPTSRPETSSLSGRGPSSAAPAPGAPRPRRPPAAAAP